MGPTKRFYNIKPGESLEEIKKKRGVSLCELLDEIKRAEEESSSGRIDQVAKLAFDNLSEDDKDAQDRLKKLRGALNKLAPDNFYIQLMEIQDYVPVHSCHLMKIFVKQLVEKAIDEPCYSLLYAHICTALQCVELAELEDEALYNFGSVLLDECYNLFCFLRSSLNWWSPESPGENDLLKLKIKEIMKRRKLVGVMRFLGNLFKAGMVNLQDIFRYVKKLEQEDSEKCIEALCMLLTTCGKELEMAILQTEFQIDWCTMWERILKQSQKESGHPPRLRFILMNLLDLMNNGWVPRLPTPGPKTFIEILEENQDSPGNKNSKKKEREESEAKWKSTESVITNEPIVVNAEKEILKLLQNDDVTNKITSWEIKNFKSRKTWFVYALARAVMRHCIDGNCLNVQKLNEHIELLKKYINSRQAELACMYAVQCVIVSQMGNPKGVLEQVCKLLHDTRTVSYIAFLDWRENWSNSPVLEVSGKAEAQITLASFFIRLFWDSIKPSSQYKSIVVELNSFDLEHFVSMSKLPPEIGKRIKMEEEREKTELKKKDKEPTVFQSFFTKSY